MLILSDGLDQNGDAYWYVSFALMSFFNFVIVHVHVIVCC